MATGARLLSIGGFTHEEARHGPCHCCRVGFGIFCKLRLQGTRKSLLSWPDVRHGMWKQLRVSLQTRLPPSLPSCMPPGTGSRLRPGLPSSLPLIFIASV
jgi:hypothetical protein